MDFNSNTKGVCNLLLESSLNLPIAFATWSFQGDVVLLSNELKSLIGCNKNLIDPYEFLKLIRHIFGGFLNIAVEKVSGSQSSKNEYTSNLKSISGEEFVLNLAFNIEKNFYIFTAKKSNQTESTKYEVSMFESIIDSLPIYIWEKNKNLQITYCNKKYSDALDTFQDSVISQNLKLISQPRKNSVYVDQNLYYSKPKKFNEHVIVKGERRLLEITEEPFVGNKKSIGYAIDITDREEIQKEYKTYKKQTEETLNNISVPIAIFDEKTKLVFANDAIIKLFNIGSFDIYGNRIFSEIVDLLLSNEAILSLNNVQKFKDDAVNLFSSVIDDPYHASMQMKSGKTMNLTVTPNRGGGLIFLFEDISDKIALEREVNSIYAVQQETLDHLTEGIIVFGSDNRIKIINPPIKRMWNKTEITKSLGVHIRDFFESSAGLFNSKIELELWISKLINLSAQRIEFSDTISLNSGKTMEYGYVPLPDGLNLVRFYDASDKANLERALKEKLTLFHK